jgi:hypothetical protein
MSACLPSRASSTISLSPVTVTAGSVKRVSCTSTSLLMVWTPASK